MPDGRLICDIENKRRFYAVAFNPNGKLAAVSGNGNAAQLLDGMTGKSLGIELTHEGSVRALVFGPDSSVLLTASFDKTARLTRVTLP